MGARLSWVKPVSREGGEWAMEEGRGGTHSWALGAGRVGNKPLFGDDQDGVSCPGDREHGSGGLLVILNIFPGAPA